ncbi:H+-ATPase G subunit-domain-containing protein [Tricharina praecox]|uniref:H+-ATPase G subunit-domain-containing protein n=1 Tax=Tricharina praecox TaxID=43433 RepID=UPI0022205E7E|nr:H+-ATPase G subunit-domain-containing protein [Tricharina praecox]KAI5853897.1 H+-ATPase G subunit-domain-containing protein [Tricharina praecox]
MSAQNSAGIQRLLDAERDAQKIVQKARTYRTQKVKEARSEAQKEIEEYKKQKEAEFKKFEEEHSGVNAQAEQESTREVEAKLQEIKTVGEEKSPKVAEELVNAVIDIHPKPHRNAAKVA